METDPNNGNKEAGRNPLRVLHLETDASGHEAARRALESGGLSCEFTEASGREEYLAALEEGRFDLILSELVLPGFSGGDALAAARERFPGVPFIFVSGTTDAEQAIEVLNQGAADYVLKDNLKRLAPAVERALHRAREQTASRRTAEAIVRERQLLRTLIDNLPDFVFIKSADGQYLISNASHTRSLGCKTEAELLGKTVFDVFPLETAAAFDLDDKMVVQTGQAVIEREEGLTTADGTRAWHLTTKVPFHDTQGRVAGLIGIKHDITQRKLAEEAGRASETHARVMLESALDCVISIDHEGRIIEFNPAAERTFGYTRAQALGQPLAELIIPPSLRGRHRRAMSRYLTSKQSSIIGQRVELSAMRADGTECPIELSITRVGTNEPPMFTGFVRDITERRQVEADRGRFAAIVQSSDDAIVSKTLQGAITSWNPGAERLFGYAAQEVLGQPMLTLIPPDRTAEETQILTRIARGEHIHPFETVRVRKDGELIAVSATISPILDGQGRIIGASNISRDITERKQAEEKIRASLAEKEALLKEIHHRVKNNMQIVSSLLNLQAARLHNPEALAAFQESRLRVQSMALVHEKLYQSHNLAELDFADYTKNLAAALFRSFGVNPSVIRLRAMIEPVKLDLNHVIPCALILNELISNSLKYAFPQGQTGEITVSLCRRPAGCLTLEVSDDGVGLPPEVDAAQARTLGLQLVGTLAKQMRGELKIGAPVRGTLFAVSIPDVSTQK